jgi:hypothetical protein
VACLDWTLGKLPTRQQFEACIFGGLGLDGVGWPRPPTKQALMHAFVPEVLNGHEYRVCTNFRNVENLKLTIH